MKINDIILRPIVTEKATGQAQGKTYTFEVGKKANKNIVKEALQTVYGVKIDDVRIMVRKGKVRKVGKKMVSKKQSDQKIAFVHVKTGSINVFPQV